jgi:autotransporter translocation and assembly factor TamB
MVSCGAVLTLGRCQTDGTDAAYGQKLTIDRGLITFIGVPGNPRLDIEATRQTEGECARRW